MLWPSLNYFFECNLQQPHAALQREWGISIQPLKKPTATSSHPPPLPTHPYHTFPPHLPTYLPTHLPTYLPTHLPKKSGKWIPKESTRKKSVYLSPVPQKLCLWIHFFVLNTGSSYLCTEFSFFSHLVSVIRKPDNWIRFRFSVGSSEWVSSKIAAPNPHGSALIQLSSLIRIMVLILKTLILNETSVQ
jgi:hypothetical protein